MDKSVSLGEDMIMEKTTALYIWGAYRLFSYINTFYVLYLFVKPYGSQTEFMQSRMIVFLHAARALSSGYTV